MCRIYKNIKKKIKKFYTRSLGQKVEKRLVSQYNTTCVTAQQICDEAGGCDQESVFPWSMSDFKPGDLIETLEYHYVNEGCFAIAMLKLRSELIPG